MTDSSDVNGNNRDQSTAMCCAQFYEQDIVQELMGGSYHPGGEDLSRALVQRLQLQKNQNVLDVACGVGTTTRMMASEFGLNATGLDFGELNIEKARAILSSSGEDTQGTASDCCAPGETCCQPDDGLVSLATAAGGEGGDAAGVVKFVQGSADALPFEDQSFEGVTCECAVSTFAQQEQVASEFFRVLKPGGVFGMTDMVLNGDLPGDFAEKVAPWTCMAKAMPAAGYRQLLESVGFEILATEDHSQSLLDLAKDMKRKLVMAGLGKALGGLPDIGMSFGEMRSMLAQATTLVNEGKVQYGLLVFRKPA